MTQWQTADMKDSSAPGGSARYELPFVLASLLLYAFLQVFVAFSFEGTYDAGDSVMHYQFARYAFSHPENFFDHWAKPVFTLLAAPFAQLGFGGMKLFQCLIALATALFGYLLAKQRGMKRPWLVIPLTLCAVEYFLAQFSGLTEPLFGLFLILGAFFHSRKQFFLAAILISFLPFVRTEGFGIAGIYAILYLFERQWKMIPALLTGSCVYAVLGMGYHDGNPLWILSENPYGSAELDNYGHGTWGHYFTQYTFVAGLPIAILTWLGLAWTSVRLVLRKLSIKHIDSLAEGNDGWVWTVLMPFAAYFLLHVVLWATGKGHSMGMSRVMIAVVPLGAVLALQGMNLLTAFLARLPYVQIGVTSAMLIYVLLFPILPNPASLKIPEDFQPSSDQVLLQRGNEWLEMNGLSSNRPVYASHPSWSYFAGADPFDTQHFRKLSGVTGKVPEGSVLVWDSWFSPLEDGVSEAYWGSFPDRFELLWRGDTVVGNSSSSIKLYFCKSGE